MVSPAGFKKSAQFRIQFKQKIPGGIAGDFRNLSSKGLFLKVCFCLCIVRV